MTSSVVALKFEKVWKKFRKGERHDSLRDLIPATVQRLFSTNHREDLQPKEFWAVSDLSFEIRRGEAVGIIGPNGSGKSTTLKLLSGIIKPTRGTLKVNGRLSALIEVAAGFHPDLTGRENVYLNGTILGMRKQEIDRKFDEIVEFSGLDSFIDTPVKRYSSGMYARLGFSIAAHVNPDILLVDEVLSVGDMSFQQRCMDKMQEKLRSEVAVIFVSHNLSAVATLCDRAILLDKGKMIVDGPCDKAVQGYVETLQTWKSKANSGDCEIKVVNAEFNPGLGIRREVMQPHTKCELLVIFECKSPVRPFNVGFVIHRTQDMYYCYGATTQELGHPLFELESGERLAVRFSFDAHLTRGQYRIDVNVRDPIGGKVFVVADGVATFMIDERVSYSGLANVGLRTSIEQLRCCHKSESKSVVGGV